MARKRGGLLLWSPSVMTRSTPPRFRATLGSCNNRIALVKWVPFRAMRFHAVFNPSVSSPDVFLLRDRFKMTRVKAGPVSA